MFSRADLLSDLCDAFDRRWAITAGISPIVLNELADRASEVAYAKFMDGSALDLLAELDTLGVPRCDDQGDLYSVRDRVLMIGTTNSATSVAMLSRVLDILEGRSTSNVHRDQSNAKLPAQEGTMTYSHFVVDGSNMAHVGRSRKKDGRSHPSARLLVRGLEALKGEFPEAEVRAVIDANMQHVVSKEEMPLLEDLIMKGLVTQAPSGMGQGDPYVLALAKQLGATVVSNDSFKEHQDAHPWLLDHGRVLGIALSSGEPEVWTFLPRTPVRADAGKAKRSASDRPSRSHNERNLPRTERLPQSDAPTAVMAQSADTPAGEVQAPPPPTVRLPAEDDDRAEKKTVAVTQRISANGSPASEVIAEYQHDETAEPASVPPRLDDESYAEWLFRQIREETHQLRHQSSYE